MQASGFCVLLLGRLVTGFGIGITSLIVPLYIAEISPPNIRGALITIGQVMTSIGILVSYIVTFAFAEQKNWREMFGFGFIPLAIFLLGLFFVPESPLWVKGYCRIKEKIQPPPYFLKTLWIGIALSIFQQITGINTVIYYAPRLFETLGSHTPESAIFNTMLIGVVNAFFSVAALFTIDWLGRRTLLIAGLIGMTLSLAALSIFIYNLMSQMALISIFFYIASFALSLGPVMGVILAEIFPLEIRGRAMGLAFFVNWFSNMIVSLTFLTLIHEIGTVLTFCMFTATCLIALWFSWKMVPETKGKTLDEIQKALCNRSKIC
jgi:MFS family permease